MTVDIGTRYKILTSSISNFWVHGAEIHNKVEQRREKKGGIVHQGNDYTTVMEVENVINKTFFHKL